ncbi:MAG TPA: hypothetical protein VF765_27725 [Polyangiaceae bacterium]
MPRFALILFVAVVVAAIAAACGSSNNNSGFPGGGADGSASSSGGGDGSSGGGDGPSLLGDGAGGSDANGPLVISPANKAIDVNYGQMMPTQTYTASIGGAVVHASFAIDLGQIGSINASTGVMTPTGRIGGTANVTATYGGQMASTQVTVRIHMSDNGAPSGYDAGGGTGGYGGVGGSGAGGQVSPGTQTVLTGQPTTDMGLSWLYPYDKTVWPQGVLPPLLQWQPGSVGNYDAVMIQMQEKGFIYQGFFSAPAMPFINHPVLLSAWDTLVYSNQGEDVTVTLVFASGGKAYGPLTETWKIAQGVLTGTVYYNSYGTALASNYCCTSTGAMFGGATLAIRHGATSPVLIAGSSGGSAQCRVCHSVAAQGATLVTQHGDDYQASSSYALTAGNTETAMPASGTATFGFPAIYPDGTFLFANAGPLPGITPPGTSGLFSIPSGAAIASTGIPAGLQGGTPVFSPDGKHVAYNDYGAGGGPLGSLDFAPATKTFSNQQTLDTAPSGQRDLFPAFLPTNDAVVFEREVANDGEYGATRNGSEGELWWVDLKSHTAAALANLNGKGYLPNGGTNHGSDAVYQYEPTVNPVPSGGYAWVVFTSRRLYGNVATQDPFLSDPRNYDPSTGITTKKLWVAAIDLNAKPGSDPSHPAFYLPGQELHAGNSRGYWVVDPCEPNGSTCLTGDQCCSGYCEDVDGGFVCGMQPPGCTGLGNKCKTSSDCCGASQGIQCIDGYCAQPNPQ